jgi:hypothetical protein
MQRRAAGLPGPQHLVDRLEQPVAVFEHEPIEVAPRAFLQRRLTREQRLEMQAD